MAGPDALTEPYTHNDGSDRHLGEPGRPCTLTLGCPAPEPNGRPGQDWLRRPDKLLYTDVYALPAEVDQQQTAALRNGLN